MFGSVTFHQSQEGQEAQEVHRGSEYDLAFCFKGKQTPEF